LLNETGDPFRENRDEVNLLIIRGIILFGAAWALSAALINSIRTKAKKRQAIGAAL